MRIFLTLGLLPLALLAGCKSEAQRIEEAKAEGLKTCNASMAQRQTPPGFDKNRFCTCIMEEATRGKSLAEIEKLDDDAMANAEAVRAGGICMAQQVTAAQPAPAAPANPSAPAPAVPEQVPQETVQETGDAAD
jgi:hypothetical protein